MKILWKSLLSIGMLVSLHGAAQTLPADRDLAAFSWEMSFPTTNKYINESSLSGWRFEYRKGIRKDISVGIALSWSAVEEFINTKTYSTPDYSKAITADMIRQAYTLPITLVGHYYPTVKSKVFEPYLGLNIGAQYAEFKTYLNIYELTDENWGFIMRPEAGTLIRFGSSSPMKGLISVGYNASTNKIDAFDVKGWNHLTVNVGIAVGTAL